MPGYPIRTSSDPRSVDSSPRHIAASHVLHRLPVPRHPPCALKHLHTKQLNQFSEESKKIASPHNKPPNPTPKGTARRFTARCSQPLSTNQTPHPTTKAGQQHTNPQPWGRPKPRVRPTSGFPHSGRRDSGPVVSKPNSVSDDSITAHPAKAESRSGSTFVVHQNHTHYRCGPSNEPPDNRLIPRFTGPARSRGAP